MLFVAMSHPFHQLLYNFLEDYQSCLLRFLYTQTKLDLYSSYLQVQEQMTLIAMIYYKSIKLYSSIKPLLKYDHFKDIIQEGHLIQFACLIGFIYFIAIMQSVELISKRGRMPRYERILNKTRQEKFNNRFSLNQKVKNYEALSDPFTSYYFANKSVKDHLKQLKRAIKYEPNFTEKTKINKLLTLRIKEKFQDVLCPKTSVYEHSLGENQLKKINQKSKSSFSNKKLDNFFSNKESKQSNTAPLVLPQNPLPKPLTTRKQTEKLPRIKHQTVKITHQIEYEELKPQINEANEKQKYKKVSPKQNQQKIIADRLALQLHQKKHDKWITFLQEKKKLIANLKTPTESPRKEASQPQKKEISPSKENLQLPRKEILQPPSQGNKQLSPQQPAK